MDTGVVLGYVVLTTKRNVQRCFELGGCCPALFVCLKKKKTRGWGFLKLVDGALKANCENCGTGFSSLSVLTVVNNVNRGPPCSALWFMKYKAQKMEIAKPWWRYSLSE